MFILLQLNLIFLILSIVLRQILSGQTLLCSPIFNLELMNQKPACIKICKTSNITDNPSTQ